MFITVDLKVKIIVATSGESPDGEQQVNKNVYSKI